MENGLCLFEERAKKGVLYPVAFQKKNCFQAKALFSTKKVFSRKAVVCCEMNSVLQTRPCFLKKQHFLAEALLSRKKVFSKHFVSSGKS